MADGGGGVCGAGLGAGRGQGRVPDEPAGIRASIHSCMGQRNGVLHSSAVTFANTQ